MFMKRRLIVTISLSLSLGVLGVHRGVLAQQTQPPIISGNVNGSCMMAPPTGNPGANAGDWTITCGDLNPGAGMTVIGPPSVDKGPVPMDVAPVPAPAPDAEPAPVDEPAPVEDPAAETAVDTVETDTAVASDTDLDADNYPDAQEVELGLDPTNVDTDGDGVADGDEGNIYGTDPTVFDTDGDGVSDGAELFDRRTDPLTWDDFTVVNTDAAAEEGAAEEVAVDEAPEDFLASPDDSKALAQESSEDLRATDGNAAALGPGNASSAPGTITRNGVSGLSLLGPDGTYKVTEISPPNVSVSGDTTVVDLVPAPAPESSPDTTDTTETVEPVVADATDTDGDGVTDDDEVALYGTDAGTWDSDGDGLSDSEELFIAGTDPLVWDTNGDGIADGDQEAADTGAPVTEGDAPVTTEDESAVVVDDGASGASSVDDDADADRLADDAEAAAGTDPTSPDSDGDGYYDGDEVNLGADPLDAASVPAT